MATFTSQPDDTTAEDTYLRGGIYADTNFGTSTSLVSKPTSTGDFQRVALIRWDLSSLAPTATVNSCAMTWYWASTYSGTATVSVYKENQAWVEAEATWNLVHTGHSWSAPGGLDPAYDYDGATVLSSYALSGDPGAQAAMTFPSTPAFVTYAQASLGGTMSLLVYNSADVNFSGYSSSAGTAALRPKLDIDYTPAGVAGGIQRHWMHYATNRGAL